MIEKKHGHGLSKSVKEHFSSGIINICLLLQLLIYSNFVRLLQCGLFYYFHMCPYTVLIVIIPQCLMVSALNN